MKVNSIILHKSRIFGLFAKHYSSVHNVAFSNPTLFACTKIALGTERRSGLLLFIGLVLQSVELDLTPELSGVMSS